MARAQRKQQSEPAAPQPDDRGEYRSVYVVLRDSPEYEDLSIEGAMLWFACRMTLGPCGIAVASIDDLVAWSKLRDLDRFNAARDELIRGNWIRIERRVWWLRNGLRFEPNLKPRTNANHRAFVARVLMALPKLQIVNEFARYYADCGLTLPFPELDGIPNPSRTHPDTIPSGIPSGYHLDQRAVDVDVDGAFDVDGEGTTAGAGVRARAGSASPEVNGGTPDFDGYAPTEGQAIRARELQVDLDHALRKWRAHRKANGHTPVDLIADFDGWIENEPQFGPERSHQQPATYTPPVYREAETKPDPKAIRMVEEIDRQRAWYEALELDSKAEIDARTEVILTTMSVGMGVGNGRRPGVLEAMRAAAQQQAIREAYAKTTPTAAA